MLKALSNVAAFVLATCVMLAITGFLLKVYWHVFMFGWGLL